jgi:tripartite-type tricarboxylate transporter receptor subunit TctC
MEEKEKIHAAKIGSLRPYTGGGPAPLTIRRRNTMEHSLLRMFGIFTLALGVVTFSAANVQCASSSGYPSKPIRLVITVAPGGSVDMVINAVAPKMSQILGQQIVSDHRGGAGGVIGTEIVAKAPPDGYTLLQIGANFVINPAMIRKLPFDSVKDFAGISTIAEVPTSLIVNPSLPVKNVKDFIALAKTWPGGLKYSSSGTGGQGHLCGEWFSAVTGVKMVHVGFKGGGPAIVAVMSGEVQAQFAALPQTVPLVAQGKVRLIAQGGKTRSPSAPDVPTFIESGLRDFTLVAGYGLLAPAGTPRPIIDRVRGALVETLADPEVRKRLASVGAEPVGNTPEEQEEFIRSEIATWI